MLYEAYLTTGLFLLSMIFWAVQMLFCRKAKHPFIRHILQVCVVIAVVVALLLDRDVFSSDHLRDFNETVASAIFYMLAAPMLLGSTAAWLFHQFRRDSKEHITTILAGVIGLGFYQLIGAFVLREVRLGTNLLFWGIMAVVFVLLEGVNAGVWQLMNLKKKK